MKINLSFLFGTLIFSLVFLGKADLVFASDFTVTCKGKNCSLSPKHQALFSVTNALPGDQFERSLTIFNYKKTNTLFFLSPSAVDLQALDQSLAGALYLSVVTGENQDRLLGPIKLSEFKNVKNPILIGLLPVNTAKSYKIMIKFTEDADNHYQNKSAQFNLAFGFEETNVESSFVSVKTGIFPQSEINDWPNHSASLSGQVAGASTEWLEPGLVKNTKMSKMIISFMGGLLFALCGTLIVGLVYRLWRKFYTVR